MKGRISASSPTSRRPANPPTASAWVTIKNTEKPQPARNHTRSLDLDFGALESAAAFECFVLIRHSIDPLDRILMTLSAMTDCRRDKSPTQDFEPYRR